MNAGKATALALRRRPLAAASGATATSGSGPELEGQVTTATPLAPSGAWPGRPREAVVDNGHGARSSRHRRKRPDLAGVVGGKFGCRDARLSHDYFPQGPGSEAACGVDKGICCLWFADNTLATFAEAIARRGRRRLRSLTRELWMRAW